jgi:hypothetical protein
VLVIGKASLDLGNLLRGQMNIHVLVFDEVLQNRRGFALPLIR